MSHDENGEHENLDRIAPTIRAMTAGEEQAVCDLILRAFDAYVAPDYTAEGQATFLEYANPMALTERSRTNCVTHLAHLGPDLAGVIEIRNGEHLSQLFVDPGYHGRGIARALLDHILPILQKARPDLERLTVNSSPYAVPIYERLGFLTTAPETNVDGLRFTPMARPLESPNTPQI